MNTSKNLPPTHAGVLRALVREGFWSPNCGWYWGGEKRTEQICNALFKKGLAGKVISMLVDRYRWEPTPAGRAWVAQAEEAKEVQL